MLRPYVLPSPNVDSCGALAPRPTAGHQTLDLGMVVRIHRGQLLRKLSNHGHRRGIRAPNRPCTDLAVAVITPAICEMRSGYPTTMITSTIHIEEGQAACDRDG